MWKNPEKLKDLENTRRAQGLRGKTHIPSRIKNQDLGRKPKELQRCYISLKSLTVFLSLFISLIFMVAKAQLGTST